MSEDLTALIGRWRNSLERRDSIALAADYADECVLDSPAYGTLKGRAAVERAQREFFTGFPDTTFEFGDCWLLGDRAVHVMTARGTDTGGFLGQAATGKPYRFFIVSLITVERGQIVYERRVYDVSGLMLQLATDDAGVTEAGRVYRAALERARTEHELETAAQTQQALLPDRRHARAGFEMAASSLPCRAIGGDFLDYFDLSDGKFALVVGDVAGKGPAAALLAGMLQGIFTGQSEWGSAPAEMLARANAALVRRAIQARFATVFYAVLSPHGQLTFCNAGHNPPFLVRNGGAQRLETGGVILGAFEDAKFEEQTLQMEPGDVLVAYSDGLTEARSIEDEEFGEQRLLSWVQGHRELAPADLLDGLLSTVQQFSAGTAQGDDLTLLVLRFSGCSVRESIN